MKPYPTLYLNAPRCKSGRINKPAVTLIAIAVSFALGFGTASYLSIDRDKRADGNEKYAQQLCQTYNDELTRDSKICDRITKARDQIYAAVGLPPADDDPLHLGLSN